jgi:hypothetical protein
MNIEPTFRRNMLLASSGLNSKPSKPVIPQDRVCGLVVGVPGYTTEMYCVSCEVRTEFVCYVEERRPPLWSNDLSFWPQIQRSEFDSRHSQIF